MCLVPTSNPWIPKPKIKTPQSPNPKSQTTPHFQQHRRELKRRQARGLGTSKPWSGRSLEVLGLQGFEGFWGLALELKLLGL